MPHKNNYFSIKYSVNHQANNARRIIFSKLEVVIVSLFKH